MEYHVHGGYDYEDDDVILLITEKKKQQKRITKYVSMNLKYKNFSLVLV